MTEEYPKPNNNTFRELKNPRLLGYTLGSLGLMLPNVLAGVFSFQYYTYTINIDSSVVLSVSFIQLFISALFSIIFGIIIDNKKPGKLGKRRPFLLYGVPIWAASLILLWFPPLPPGQSDTPVFYVPTIIFFSIMAIIRSITSSMMMSSHTALLPELSQTLKNRKRISEYNTFFYIMASVIGMAAPMLIQLLLPEPDYARYWTYSGDLMRFYMPLLGIIFTIFGVISIVITYFAVSHEKSFYQGEDYSVVPKRDIRSTFKQIFTPIRNIQFAKFLGVVFFASIAGSILGKTINPFLLYVIRPSLPEEIKGIEMIIYPIISFTFKFAWLYIWILFFKKLKLSTKFKWNFVSMILMSFSILLFLIEIIYPDLLSYRWSIALLIISIGSILGGMYSRRYFQSPFLAALIDEAIHDLNGDKFNGVSKLSGGFYGLNSFVMNIGSAVANLIIGFTLTHNNREDRIIITILFASMGIFYLISWLFLKFVKLKQEI